MAKKKDLDDENINEENQGDINEADDSFGLPDIDYKPLDEQESVEDEPVAESEPEPQEEEQETYAYTADEDDAETSDAEEEEQPAYVPGSYTPPKQESNKAGIVMGVIIVLLLAAVAVWYFGFHQPAKEAELARIEKQKKHVEENYDV